MKSRMAHIAIITILALIGTHGKAKAETLLGDTIYDNGFSIECGMMTTQFNDKAVAMSGIRLHWVINHNIGIGLYSYDSVTDGNYSYNTNDYKFRVELSGMDISYTVNPDDLLHWGGSLAFGGGHIDFHSNTFAGNNVDPDDEFFFVQPMLHSELNLIDDFKLGASAGYRFTSGVNTIDLLNKDMNGYVLALTLKYAF